VPSTAPASPHACPLPPCPAARRESPAGLSTVSYFCGKLLADTLDIIVRPLVFYAVFYSVAFPQVGRPAGQGLACPSAAD
jgi:hypothetical protein